MIVNYCNASWRPRVSMNMLFMGRMRFNIMLVEWTELEVHILYFRSYVSAKVHKDAMKSIPNLNNDM